MSPSKPVSRPPAHPTISDVALALATRRSDPTSTVKISDANAKGAVQLDVAVTDADPAIAAQRAADLYDTLRAKYPRENGGAS